MKKDDQTVREMRDRIAALTGHLPVSHSPKYLAERLRRLELDGPRPSPTDAPDRAVPITVSMTSVRRDLLHRMAHDAKVKASEIVRRALDLYAKEHGYEKDMRAVQKMDALLNGVDHA